jgi:hypothetical protein
MDHTLWLWHGTNGGIYRKCRCPSGSLGLRHSTSRHQLPASVSIYQKTGAWICKEFTLLLARFTRRDIHNGFLPHAILRTRLFNPQQRHSLPFTLATPHSRWGYGLLFLYSFKSLMSVTQDRVNKPDRAIPVGSASQARHQLPLCLRNKICFYACAYFIHVPDYSPLDVQNSSAQLPRLIALGHSQGLVHGRAALFATVSHLAH